MPHAAAAPAVGSGPVLSRATDADVPAVVDLVNRAYRSTGSGWTTEAAYLAGTRTTERMLRDDVAARPQAFLLTWRDPDSRRLLGTVWLEPLAPVADGRWYLGSLAVEPDRQGSGLGRAVLAAAERWVLDRGGVRVRMTVVNVRDTLIAWYGRRGYAPTGETEPFPYGDDRFGTPLRPDLAFVVLEKQLSARA